MEQTSKSSQQYFQMISKDSQLIKLLEYLVSKKSGELQPAFDIVTGYHYPDVVSALSVTPKESLEIVKRLVAMGAATEEYTEQVIRCPYCNSEYTTVRFHCPFCNSKRLSKEVLIEHKPDGAIAPVSKYVKGDKKMVCPVCNKPLVEEGKDYRAVGVWYSCMSCGKQFDTPKNTYLCLGCGKDFSTPELIISFVNKIVVKKEVMDDFFKQYFVLQPVTDLLVQLGFNCQSPGLIAGKSGYTHTFNIVAKDGGGKTYAIDFVKSESYVEESSVLALFAKVLDTKPDQAYLICIPGITEGGKRFAAMYNIKVVEGGTMAEVISKMKVQLSGQPGPAAGSVLESEAAEPGTSKPIEGKSEITPPEATGGAEPSVGTASVGAPTGKPQKSGSRLF
ncbi:MAG: hypothetical protein ACQXXL_00420 [Candidatus Methanosuratincola sp.]